MTTLFTLLFIVILITIAVIDMRYMIIPDILTLPTLWLGLLVNILPLFCPLPDAVIGAVVGYLFLWAVYHLFKMLTGKEGLGHGDFKLLSMIGAWLGWQSLPLVLLIASVSGLLVAFLRVFAEWQRYKAPLPFGPYLALGATLVLLWPDYFHHFTQLFFN